VRGLALGAQDARGIKRGDTVSVMLANTPAALECHYGVPMTQGVLNTLNTRLDAAIIAFSLDHADAKVVIIDREFSKVMKEALSLCKAKPLVIDYDDPEYSGQGSDRGDGSARSNTRTSSPQATPTTAWAMPDDEWDAITLKLHLRHYGRSEGRGLSSPRRASLGDGQCHHLPHEAASGVSVDAADVPLQRLVLPVDGVDRRRTHVCLRAVRAAAMYDAIATHKVTHLCGAPIVMATLLNATEAERKPLPHVVDSPPPRRRRRRPCWRR